MSGRKSSTFTEVELEFMKIIWEQGEVSTEDVLDVLSKRGRELSDGTVRKMLSILMNKGHITRTRNGRSFLYRAKVRKKQADKRMIRDLLSRAFGDSASLMVAAILDSSSVSDEEIQEIKQLIAEHERSGK